MGETTKSSQKIKGFMGPQGSLLAWAGMLVLSGPELSLAFLKEQEPVGCQEGTWHSRPRGSMSKRRGKGSMGNSGNWCCNDAEAGSGKPGRGLCLLGPSFSKGKNLNDFLT